MNKSFKKNSADYQEADRIRPTLNLNRTIAKDAFICRTRPWDAILNISDFIKQKGRNLRYEEYDEIAENVWVHVSAYLSPYAKISAPAIICGGAKVCHYSLVSESVVGAFASVGELSIVKNSIMFDRSKLFSHNELLSSILGYEAYMGNAAITADLRIDGMNISVDMPEGTYVFGKQRLGCVICDGVKIGASALINPGTVIDTGAKIYPLTTVSGYIYPYSSVGLSR